VSATQLQQEMLDGRAHGLPVSSKQQQPGSLVRRRSKGIRAGSAGVALAALGYCLVLGYAAASALIAQNGYSEMAARQEIEELHGQIALLSHQAGVARSEASIRQAAGRLRMRAADLRTEVDFVMLADPGPMGMTRVAAAGPMGDSSSLTGALAELAVGVVGSAEGRAEASTGAGHRR